jgi:hypothetical protein
LAGSGLPIASQLTRQPDLIFLAKSYVGREPSARWLPATSNVPREYSIGGRKLVAQHLPGLCRATSLIQGSACSSRQTLHLSARLSRHARRGDGAVASHDEELASLCAVNEEKRAEMVSACSRCGCPGRNCQARRIREIEGLARNDYAKAKPARLHETVVARRRRRFGSRPEKFDDEQSEMAFKNCEAAVTAVAVSLDAVALIPARATSAQNPRGGSPLPCGGLRTSPTSRTRYVAAAAYSPRSRQKCLRASRRSAASARVFVTRRPLIWLLRI